MNKEELLNEFLQGLRIAISNSLAYPREHPYFLKSSQEFKKKIDELASQLNPIKVDVSQDSIFLEGKPCDKFIFSRELAQTLHQRKIKSIKFSSGISAEELADFLSLLSLQPKELLRKGGLSTLLKESNIRQVSVEELDYSALLGSGGEDAKDIWLYLFKNNVAKQGGLGSSSSVSELAEGVGALSSGEIIQDEELRSGLNTLIRAMKKGNSEKLSTCLQQISSVIFDSGGQPNEEETSKFKEVFAGLDPKDISDVIYLRIAKGAKVDTFSLNFFSKLVGKENEDEVLNALKKNKAAFNKDPLFMKRIKDLLDSPSAQNLSPAYRNTLSSLFKDITYKNSSAFDQKNLLASYSDTLLNLLAQDNTQEGSALISERLIKDWVNITARKDYKYIRDLWSISNMKNKEGRIPEEIFARINKQIIDLIDLDMWEDPASEDFIYLLSSLDKTYLGAEEYLKKFFEEGKLSVYALRQFLKHHPALMEAFYDQLKAKHADLEFLSSMVEKLARVNLPISSVIFKEIYALGNDLVKVMVLKEIPLLGDFDPEFLLAILKEKSVSLRKEALMALVKYKDEAYLNKALGFLLNFSSPWGSKNILLIENIRIIQELKIGSSKDILFNLSKRRFFWNWALRQAALKALGELND